MTRRLVKAKRNVEDGKEHFQYVVLKGYGADTEVDAFLSI